MVFSLFSRSFFFLFSSRRRHTSFDCDWSSDVCSSDLPGRPIVDGWYVTEDLSTTYARGRQTDVDVLVGSNQNEAGFAFFGVPKGSAAEFTAQVRSRFADRADQFLTIYPAGNDTESNAAQVASFNDEVAWNMRSWALSESKRGKGRAYLYYFT